MNRLKKKRMAHSQRKKHGRKVIRGTGQSPRLSVFKSLKHIYAQVIDDEKGMTLVAASTQSRELRGALSVGGNINAAQEVGALIARKAKEKGVESVVFDRGGNLYHGRVKRLAEAARRGGLRF